MIINEKDIMNNRGAYHGKKAIVMAIENPSEEDIIKVGDTVFIGAENLFPQLFRTMEDLIENNDNNDCMDNGDTIRIINE